MELNLKNKISSLSSVMVWLGWFFYKENAGLNPGTVSNERKKGGQSSLEVRLSVQSRQYKALSILSSWNHMELTKRFSLLSATYKIQTRELPAYPE